MTPPSSAHLEWARRLLAHEGVPGSLDAQSAAAGRVYDKLHAHLAPLIGAAGVQALLVRSARLTQPQFRFLDVALLEDSLKLSEGLQAQGPAVAAESAAALFATFFALVTTFIGERLTTQLLRSAWPMIANMAPTENKT